MALEIKSGKNIRKGEVGRGSFFLACGDEAKQAKRNDAISFCMA
jgi:hypothetical protein